MKFNQWVSKETVKKIFQFIGISFFLFVILGAGLEYFFYRKCRSEGLLEKKYFYGLKVNPYYSTENTPNFTYRASDSLFKPAELHTDSNSFISDVPISVVKPKKTIRIFLAGASAMFGTIQVKTLVSSDNYPEGVYAYNASIAGQVKQKLQKKYPGYAFEVINTGVPNHCFYQTWQMYIARMHAFKPDIVVNMDGNNDGWGYFIGKNFDDPYKQKEREALIDLELKCRESKFPYTITYYRSWREKNAGALLRKKEVYAPVPYGIEDYKKIEPEMIRASQTTLWTIASYERQLQADSVFSIRVLQPLLLRRGRQKALSDLEKSFVAQLDKTMFLDDATVKDSQFSAYTVLKEKLPEIHNIAFGWFFDEYFSQAEDSIVRLHGGTFIDMNERIATLKASDEFYVDYCHLTPWGNGFLAQQLVEAMEGFITKKITN